MDFSPPFIPNRAIKMGVSHPHPPKISRLTDEELVKIEEKLPALVDVCAHAARALPPTTKISLDEDVLEDLQRVAGPNFCRKSKGR